MLKSRRWLRRSGFHLLKLLARVGAWAGPARLRKLGEALGSAHFRLGTAKRKRLLTQMSILMPERAASGTLPARLQEAYRVNDRAILEILAAYSGALDGGELARACRLENTSVLDQSLDEGKGVVLLGMHMGNGVALAIHLAHRGYPVSVVYRESNKISPSFFARGIERNGVHAIGATPASAGFRRMLRALRSGGIIFILMDQASKKGGIPAHFLGKNLQMPPGPAELARRTGAPVIPVLLCGTHDGWQFRLGEPIKLDRSQPLDEQVKMLTGRIEEHILSHPQWWTWHQRRWHRYPFGSTTDN